MELQEARCYVCVSSKSTPYDQENGYTLVRCSGCGLLYVSPRPSDTEISQATKTGQHHGADTIDVTGKFSLELIPRYLGILGDFFASFEPGQRWLDIGCGHGEFLTALGQFSGGKLRTVGCEPNRFKVESAKSRGLDVSCFDLDRHDQKYDYLSMLNVYSHLPNPIETIGNWKKLLKPGGTLFLETGHSSHLSARDHHKPYYLPDHLSFGNEALVRRVLKQTGFEVLAVKRYRHTVFPPLRLRRLAKESIKLLLRRPNQVRLLLPREPRRDMFVKARLLTPS